MKKIIGLLIICAIAVFSIVSIGRTNYKSYYSGDAVYFQNNIIIASTDSGSLEVFKQIGPNLERDIKLKAPNSPLDQTYDFSSVKLNVENGRLYAYATSAFTLYKYDITDLNRPVLFAKQKNTYYEWYNRVDKFGSNIVTISNHNIRVWRSDLSSLDIINSYQVDNDVTSAVTFDSRGRYIATINKDNLVRIYDTNTRTNISVFPVNYRDTQSLRKSYFDPSTGDLYVYDDYYLKRFDLSGNLVVSSPNSSVNSFAVEPSGNANYIYAVNGDSVMKLAKDNLRGGLKISAGNLTANGYAMGVKYVNTDGGERIVVFNSGGITVLNSSLGKLSKADATQIPDQPEVREPLALSFDHNTATIGAVVNLSGAGYLPNEPLQITFGGAVTKLSADNYGRFTQALTVPKVDNYIKSIDAKVDGLTSELTYSTSFNMIQVK